MEYPYIKNITHEKVQTLTSLVNAEDGQIVSKTLAQNEAVSVTLFAFAKGEGDLHPRFHRRCDGNGSGRHRTFYR